MVGKIKILVVDDNPDMTRTLADILSALDYEVMIAGDGNEALNLARDHEFDFALMDIIMPGMNGVDIMKQIKLLQPKMKVLIMTGYSISDLVDEARRAGADHIINKPFEPEVLIALLKGENSARMPNSDGSKWNSF